MKEKNSKTMAIISMTLGIVGLLTTCVLIGIPISVVGMIIGIIVLAKNKPGKAFAITGIITSACAFLLFVLIIIYANLNMKKNSEVAVSYTIKETAESIVKEETAIVNESSTTEEEITTVETESLEEFKASCQEIGYKKLLRSPEEYVGRRIVITAKVQQVVGGGLFADETYYRVQTDKDGYEWYHDDEYFMYDSRIDDDMKILEADVLKIYAEFTGLEDVRRAITGSNEEVPAIKAYYVELISE